MIFKSIEIITINHVVNGGDKVVRRLFIAQPKLSILHFFYKKLYPVYDKIAKSPFESRARHLIEKFLRV